MNSKTITISYDKNMFKQNTNMDVVITPEKLTINFSNVSLGVTNQDNGDMTTIVYKPHFISNSSVSGDYSSVSGRPITNHPVYGKHESWCSGYLRGWLQFDEWIYLYLFRK